jgi:Carboxypeptidase regulatory-like domain
MRAPEDFVRQKTVLWLAVTVIAVVVSAAAQGGRESDLRTVQGHVLNAQEQPVQKAVVHLKNTRTLAIKTYITEPDGSYRFSALSSNVDYELYAESDGQRSDTKTLSAFDSRKQITMTLKLKPAH